MTALVAQHLSLCCQSGSEFLELRRQTLNRDSGETLCMTRLLKARAGFFFVASVRFHAA